MNGNFTEFALGLLRSCNLPAKCSSCGNPNIEELAISGRGRVICRADIPAIREACSNKAQGWRILDSSGRVVSSGAGITFRPTSEIMNWYGCP